MKYLAIIIIFCLLLTSCFEDEVKNNLQPLLNNFSCKKDELVKLKNAFQTLWNKKFTTSTSVFETKQSFTYSSSSKAPVINFFEDLNSSIAKTCPKEVLACVRFKKNSWSQRQGPYGHYISLSGASSEMGFEIYEEWTGFDEGDRTSYDLSFRQPKHLEAVMNCMIAAYDQNNESLTKVREDVLAGINYQEQHYGKQIEKLLIAALNDKDAKHAYILNSAEIAKNQKWIELRNKITDNLYYHTRLIDDFYYTVTQIFFPYKLPKFGYLLENKESSTIYFGITNSSGQPYPYLYVFERRDAKIVFKGKRYGS